MMKTVEIVTMSNGWFVTRLYCKQNMGHEFFFSKAPYNITKKKDIKEFLAKNAAAKEKYIKDWTGE